MLAVDKDLRKRGIATTLVRKAIEEMDAQGADEVVLEAEDTNTAALHLYEKLGCGNHTHATHCLCYTDLTLLTFLLLFRFARDKRLHKYYLSGTDAFRLKLWLKNDAAKPEDEGEDDLGGVTAN